MTHYLIVYQATIPKYDATLKREYNETLFGNISLNLPKKITIGAVKIIYNTIGNKLNTDSSNIVILNIIKLEENK